MLEAPGNDPESVTRRPAMSVTSYNARPPSWPRVGVACAMTAALSAGAGWSARGEGDAAHVAAALPAAAAGAVASAAPAVVPPTPAPKLEQPLIVVAGDGRVTLRVEQQPLEWVLEQIAS